MTYEKPNVDVVELDNDGGFMTGSVELPFTAADALQSGCSGFSGATNNFTCGVFGDYSPTNPPSQHSTVTLAGGTYIFDHVGNHWKLHKGN